jgi:hypothetical protein
MASGDQYYGTFAWENPTEEGNPPTSGTTHQRAFNMDLGDSDATAYDGIGRCWGRFRVHRAVKGSV